MVKNYLKSIRFVNLILLFLLFWGLLFQIKPNPFFSTVNLDTILLSLSIILTTAAGYLINNFFDFNSDAINGKKSILFFQKLLSYFIHYSYLIIVLLGFYIKFIGSLDPTCVLLSHADFIILCFLTAHTLNWKSIRGSALWNSGLHTAYFTCWFPMG